MEPKSQPAPYLLLLVSLTVSWLQAWAAEETAHPEVTIETKRLNGMVGEAVLLPASVVNVPGEGRLFWKAMRKPPVKVAEVTLQDNRTVIYRQTGFENRIQLFPNFTLQIQNLTMRDKGQYKVTLSFEALEPEASVQLDVYEPIRGTVVTITSVDSTNQSCVVTLSCSTMERTAVNFSWSLSEAVDSKTKNESSLEVTLDPNSDHPVVVCTARNPVSWQDSSKDLDMVCQTNNTEVFQLTSGKLALSVVSCGVVFFILIAAGFLYWSHRGRGARWEDLTSESAVNKQSAGPDQTHSKYRQQVVVIHRSDSMPSSGPVSPTPHLWQLGPEECDDSEVQTPTKTPLPVLETEV